MGPDGGTADCGGAEAGWEAEGDQMTCLPECKRPEWGWEGPDEWTCPVCGTRYKVEQHSGFDPDDDSGQSWCFYRLMPVAPTPDSPPLSRG